MSTSLDAIQSALAPSFGGSPAFRPGPAMLAWSDVDNILPAITTGLRKFMPYDYAAILFQDENAGGHIRLRELSSSPRSGAIRKAGPPPALAPAAWVFANRKLLLVSRCDATLCPDPFGYLQGEINFGCWIPVVRSGKTIAVLVVGSRHDAQLEQRVIDLLAPCAHPAGALEISEDIHDDVDPTTRLREEKAYLEGELRGEWGFENVIGMSAGFRDVIERMREVSRGHETVLIVGEHGTEKELIARLIHQLSPRHRRIFVKVNCSANPARALAKKLFGYEKTGVGGVVVKRMGRLELAHLSTLFLEEVADLPAELQSMLVRVLKNKKLPQSDGQVRPALDIRLVASTSRDLLVLVNSGQFNRDLYNVLTEFPIELLPLRKRSGDIPLLVNHFVSKFAKRMKKSIIAVPQETMSALCARQWPWNVRELENFVERAVILTPGSTLHAPLIALEVSSEENLEAAERKHIIGILRNCKGVIGGPAGAAKRLGVKRTTLNSKLKKLGIQREAYS